MLYFHSFKSQSPLIIDIVDDVVKLNNLALHASKTGVIILGGGEVIAVTDFKRKSFEFNFA